MGVLVIEWMSGCAFCNNSASLGHDVCFDWNSTISTNVFDLYRSILTNNENRVISYYYYYSLMYNG